MRVLIFYHYSILGLRIQNTINSLLSLGYSVILVYWARKKSSINEFVDAELSDNGKDFRAIPVYFANPKSAILQLLIMPFIYFKFLAASLRLKFDVLHFTHLFFLPLGLFVAKLKKAKTVYDSYEFYVLEFKHKLPFILRWLAGIIQLTEGALVPLVDGIFTVDSVNDFYENFYRLRNKNTFVLYNLPALRNEEERPSFDFARRKKWIVYIGGVEEAKGLEPALKSFVKIKKEIPEAKLFFIGILHKNAQEKFYCFVKDPRLSDSICHIGWSSYDEMLKYLSDAYLGIALYQPFWLYNLTSLGNGRKIFTYMERGLPVIGPSFGETARVVKEEQCGILVDTSDPGKIAEAAIYLFKHPEEAEGMSRKGRKAVEEKYNWERESKKLIDFYKNLDK